MDPVTLLVFTSLTASAAVTARSPWSAPRIEEKTPGLVIFQSIPAPTNLLVAPAVVAAPLVTLKDRLLTEIQQFSLGAADPVVSTHEDIATAEAILKALPAGLPLPVLMRNDNGQIGMYWDSEGAYADINIEPGHIFSFFSRSRVSGQERFIDALQVTAFTSAWAFDNLSVLVDGQLAAA